MHGYISDKLNIPSNTFWCYKDPNVFREILLKISEADPNGRAVSGVGL
jgi:hypothetical protein